MVTGQRRSVRRLAAGVAVAAAIVLCVLSGRGALAGTDGAYLGWEQCATCHQEVTAAWKKSRHAKAFVSLKKSNQEGLPGCLKCHVTGYEETGGFIDFELTPELADVQCEECHGAGGRHVAGGGAKSDIVAKPSEEKCRKCHTPGQDKAFSYAQKIKHIHPTHKEVTK